MSDRLVQWIARFCLLFLIMMILQIFFSGCQSTRILSDTKTVTVTDSTTLELFQDKQDSLVLAMKILHNEKTLLLQKLASRQMGTGEKDSAMPVKRFLRYSGSAYIDISYQGFINEYDFFIPPEQSVFKSTTTSDSTYRMEMSKIRDSIGYWRSQAYLYESMINSEKKLSFFDKIIQTIRHAWWLILAGLILYPLTLGRIRFLNALLGLSR